MKQEHTLFMNTGACFFKALESIHGQSHFTQVRLQYFELYRILEAQASDYLNIKLFSYLSGNYWYIIHFK